MDDGLDLKAIARDGARAPSGENGQPWRIRIADNSIEIHLDPSKNTSLYSAGQRASYVACGAVIENILISASAHGAQTQLALFPEKNDDYLVARISFELNQQVYPDRLSSAIAERSTNRKPFQTAAPTADEIDQLEAAAKAAGATLTLVTDRHLIEQLAAVGSNNERIMFNTPLLLNFFLKSLTWTPAEDRARGGGFYIETLELPPPAKAIVKLMYSPLGARFLQLIGIPNLIASQNTALNKQCGAMGIISMPSDSPANAVTAGRAMERVWLTTTALGYSLQPLTGILYFKLWLELEDPNVFPQHFRSLVEQSYAHIESIFGSGTQYFMFRLGRSEPPSAHTIRRPI